VDWTLDLVVRGNRRGELLPDTFVVGLCDLFCEMSVCSRHNYMASFLRVCVHRVPGHFTICGKWF
jgi:hypothetical protein